MNSSVRIICPACYSARLDMYLRGLSSNAAGSMTMPAGNVRDNNMEMRCKDCGKIFEPAEGKMQQEVHADTGTTLDSGFAAPDNNQVIASPPGGNINLQDKQVTALIMQQGKLQAIKYLKDTTGMALKEAKDHVDRLSTAGNLMPKKEGCFIATACYGQYDEVEVLRLRRFRDERLAPYRSGRLLIALYYRLSPTLAKKISGSGKARDFIRTYFLSPLVRWLDQ